MTSKEKEAYMRLMAFGWLLDAVLGILPLFEIFET